MAQLAATPTKAGGSDYTRKTETLVDPRILEFRQMGQENGKRTGLGPVSCWILLDSAGHLLAAVCLPKWIVIGCQTASANENGTWEPHDRLHS